MGFRYSTLLIVTLLLGATLSLFAQMGGDLPPANMEGITAPITNKETGQYMAILYAKGGKVSGYHLTNVRVDLIQSTVKDPKTIQDISHIKIYEFGTKCKKTIDAFWNKYAHSQAIIESEDVVLNPTTKILTGEKRVNIYAKDADVQGRGFSYELETKRLEIHNDVHIIVRSTTGTDLDYSPKKNKE